MIDIAQVKIGDRWFLRFEESLTPVDWIDEIRLNEKSIHNPMIGGIDQDVKDGQVVVRLKSGAYAVRTPVKPEYVDCLCGRGFMKPADF